MPHSWFVDGFIGPRIVSRPRARSHDSAALNKRVRRLLVFVALEEPEEADAIVVKVVVRAVLDRGDSSDRLSVAHGEKQLAVGGLGRTDSFLVQRIANGDAQRRDPLRVIRRL